MKRIIDYLKSLPIYVYIVVAFLGFALLVTSCQGLFNVNGEDNQVIVADSFKGGNK